MKVLGIESSCDETAAAVVEGGRKVLSNIVVSQVKDHALFGGVVPEVASRKHTEAIVPVINAALGDAGLGLDDIDGIAVTQGPGLVGALLVGLSVAKSLAFARNIPFVGINHIEGHLTAIFLEEEVEFPYVGLIVSGGHTSIYLVKDLGDYQLLGKTIDDAAGEAFDKVAKVLGLGYPGGALMDRLAKQGDCKAIRFPRGLLGKAKFNFSFSGMKTAASQYIKKQHEDLIGGMTNDIAASFQEAIVDVLVKKTVAAAEQSDVKSIVISGGVACNSRLRARMAEIAKEAGIKTCFPSPVFCTDNAAMIAALGDYYLKSGKRSDLAMNAVARWEV
ncbi:MAG: tRNA (adenosine(37)-N6)-threonylcarbamoyltransferase complex transferase subunit TsaD [Proteobacteria bacterium]|nr:tRNA (adenosine(37)-N6)-threonylcarbamoyltransferase complex transferase subunit TsaD [Pseudomonadota bacterium]